MRNYQIADHKALQTSRTTKKLFYRYVSDFTEFDSELNADFSVQWQQATTNAENEPTDEAIMDQMQGMTAAVATQSLNCIEAAEDARYYLKKAYVGDERKEMLKEFGFGTLQKVRHNAPHLIVWTLVLHNRVEKYKAPLMEKGMTQAHIDNIEAQAQKLITAEFAQEVFKRERLAITRKRISVFNNMWSYIETVIEAATIVYNGNEQMLGVFDIKGDTN